MRPCQVPSLLMKYLLSLTMLLFSVSSYASVLQLQIDGAIHEGTVHTIEQALAQAKEEKHEALLITLDTPGGLLDSTRKIVKIFLNEDFPIIVYVSPSGSRAGSAGTFITMAAHIAAMAPGTNIGAAHPVSATGADPEEGGKHMAEKIENDTIAFIESIAKQRGRNVEWAKKAVLESDSIIDSEAKRIGVIDLVAKDIPTLLAEIDGKKINTSDGQIALNTRGANITMFEFDLKSKLLNFLAHPTTMMILVAIIGLGLYIEFSNPGLIFPATASIIALFLFMISTSVIPITMLGGVLILLAFVSLFLEVYVASFGLLTALGVALFIAGSLLLFDPTTSDLYVPRNLIWSMGVGLGVIGGILAYSIGRTIKQPAAMGPSTLVGTRTTLVQPITENEDGKIFAQGDYWNVKSSAPIAERPRG